MPAPQLNSYTLAVNFNAAIAVTGYQYGVSVRRLSLHVTHGKRDRPKLMALPDCLRIRGPTGRTQACMDYATVLLSGSVGRFLALESWLGFAERDPERGRLERAYLGEACLCLEPETDHAFAIVLGWLGNLDQGDAMLTFSKVWRRALMLLRHGLYRDHMTRIAARLRNQQELRQREIAEILSK